MPPCAAIRTPLNSSEWSESYLGDMRPDIEMLTPAEAAVIARVSVRDINRVIDEGILPDRFFAVSGGRRIHAAACPLVGFYFNSARALTAEERGRLIRRVSERIGPPASGRPGKDYKDAVGKPEDWTIQDGFLTVRLWEFVAGAEDRRAKLAEARGMVIEDPEILSGTPVIGGTRIPVYDVAASVTAALPNDRIRSAYPGITDAQIELAAIYAEAAPPRGRPRRRAFGETGARVVSRRRAGRLRPG